jgi:hypothetical protein
MTKGTAVALAAAVAALTVFVTVIALGPAVYDRIEVGFALWARELAAASDARGAVLMLVPLLGTLIRRRLQR